MLDSLLACPRCDNALKSNQGAYSCGGCQVDFPNLEDIPFLFAEPAATLGEWRARMNMEVQRLEHEAERHARALDGPELLEPTRRRLEHQRMANSDHARRLRQLLEPLGAGTEAAAFETYLSLRTRLPGSQGLSTYYANIHRDWCWGEKENLVCADIVAGVLGTSVGNLLVPGSGGSRLAYDLHRRSKAQLTVALDFNPLLMLLARRLVHGAVIQLWEFPLAPNSIADTAVLRSLQAPEPIDDRFHFVIADALRAPFQPGSFDTILTPWVTDILPVDFDQLCVRINRLLKPGGRWVNFGSLVFDRPDPARNYSAEEVGDWLQKTGFAAVNFQEDRIPYMCSPSSRHGRTETVVTFSARKQADAPAIPRHTALPEWLVRNSEPVPLLPAFQSQALSTRVHAFVMAMIDGQRSIADMAALMEEQRLMTRAEAEPVIRQFLIKMFDQ